MSWFGGALHSRNEKRALVGMLAIVLTVHALSFLYFLNLSHSNPAGVAYPIVPADSSYYARTAQNLITYHTFTDSLADLKPTNANLPGYPFLLAVTKTLTGSFAPLVLAQEALLIYALVLIFSIARRVVPFWYALLAAFLFGIEPMVVFTTTTLLTDSMFVSLLVIAVYHGFFNDRIGLAARSAIVGLILGGCALLRPTGLLVVPIVIGFFAAAQWLRHAQRPAREAISAAAIAALCALFFIAPWMVRNKTQLDTYEFIHSGPHAFLDYNVRYFLAWRELQKSGPASVYYPARHLTDPAIAAADAAIRNAWAARTPAGDDPEKYVGAVAFEFIKNDPIRYAYFHLAHLPVFFLSSGIGSYKQVIEQVGSKQTGGRSTMYETIAAIKDIARPDQAVRAAARVAPILLEVLFWLAVSIFALFGLLFERRRIEVWLFAALAGYFGVIAGAVTVARYRVSAEPFLLILASYGASYILSRAYAAYAAGSRAGERVPGWARFLELVRYVIAGVTALASSVIVYSVLVYFADVEYVVASIFGFLVAFFVSFVLQKFFAFRDQAGPGRGGQVGQYFLLLVFNIAINTFLLTFFVGYIGMGKLLGLLYANGLVAVWNFFIYDKLIFTERELAPHAPHRSTESLEHLSVVIPCFNEEGSIGAVIDSIPKGVGEIIVVDNNSTDRTAEIARMRGARIVEEKIPGAGSAMRAGLRAATMPLVAVIDGDNQHPAGELPRMVEMLNREELDFISAARFPLSENWLRGFGNWGLTLVANLLFGLALTDSQSGMVVFRREILPDIEPRSNDVVFVQELKIRAAKRAETNFAETRIPCIPRTTGASKLLPVRHGAKLLFAMIALRMKL